MSPPDTWTAEQIATLTKMRIEKKSITAIGLAIGVSRNAVAGKARRLGLPKMASPIKPGSSASGRKPVKVRLTRVAETAGIGPGKSMLHTGRNDCAWPLWNNRERATFRVCGKPAADGCAYCGIHAAIAYRVMA